MEQRCALALGEAALAGVAVEQADVVVLAVARADGEVACVASAVEWAIGLLAAEARLFESDNKDRDECESNSEQVLRYGNIRIFSTEGFYQPGTCVISGKGTADRSDAAYQTKGKRISGRRGETSP